MFRSVSRVATFLEVIEGSYSSLKERAGVKRGFGLRFRGGEGVCRAC
jgi:hypothetical protein